MPEYQFNNFTELYDFIVSQGVERTPSISSFVSIVDNISVGCGCSRGARVKRAEEFYLSLSMSMDLVAQDSIKDAANADIVKLYHESGLFFQF